MITLFKLWLAEPFLCVWRHRGLALELTKRDFAGRYQGSALGMGWSLFNPLLLLAIYSVVFGVALQVKWAGSEAGNANFSVILFVGLIVHGFISECLVRAPTLIVNQPNYVKKVIFPLEIIPWVAMVSALAHLVLGFLILLLFILMFGGSIGLGLFLVPIILLPLVLLAMGLSWLLASAGVFLRDLAQGMGVVSLVLLFMSPVFFPRESLPGQYQLLLVINPVTFPVEQIRNVLLWGRPISLVDWVVAMVISAVVFWGGFIVFRKSKRAFADVL